MKENLCDGHGLPSPDHRRDNYSRVLHSSNATSSVLLPGAVPAVLARTFGLIPPRGALQQAWQAAPHLEAASPRAEPTGLGRPGVMHRIIAAIRLRRSHTRSRPELRHLSDLVLDDIGLRREDVGYPFVQPLWVLRLDCL